MANINELIREVKDLRGTEVTVFGQRVKIDEEVSPYLIDTIDVLKSLKSFEADMIIGDDDEFEDIYTDNIEEYLEYLDNLCGLEEINHDNSYNWNSNLSNDIDFITYKVGEEYYVKMMVHRGYGDIRCNYTDYCLLRFTGENEFLETVFECYDCKRLTIDGIDYLIDIYPTSEELQISMIDENGNIDDIGYLYGYYDNDKEMEIAIRELIA